ncbi:DUF1559 domain-containing protein [Schlesneria sp. DSM 10557]|uniref:DUF1559 family PulG-like putative transporter n=1 Tax=Schlesneria sp. DSM 10557 TaxID=3044399 RepID=UPI0035A18A25
MKRLKIVGVVLLVLAVLAAMLIPAVQAARQAARQSQSHCRLKQLGLALHNYQGTYGVFPPAYTVDAEGKPLHSWRTLILPYLDEQKLYDSIDLAKPWNDRANEPARKTAVGVYQSPWGAEDSTMTPFLAMVTPESVLRPMQSCKLEDVTDGASMTLMLIEVPTDQMGDWISPGDADDETLRKLASTTTSPSAKGVGILLVDGSVRNLDYKIPLDQLRALVTVSGHDEAGGF